MTILARLLPALVLFAVCIIPTEVRADTLQLTSGFVSVGGPAWPSRGQFRSIGFDFSVDGLSARGSQGDGRTQSVAGPCTGPSCAPGTEFTVNSTIRLSESSPGSGSAFIPGVGPVSPARFGDTGGSPFSFVGSGLTIPVGDAPSVTLQTEFTMTGLLVIEQFGTGWTEVYRNFIAGYGIATVRLDLVRFGPNPSDVRYAITNIRYDFKPVPEPATLLLLGTGLAGVAARYRRTRLRR